MAYVEASGSACALTGMGKTDTAHRIASGGLSPHLRVGLSLVIPLAMTIAYLGGIMAAPAGGFADSDCYMHLLRAEKLWETGRWYDSTIDRSNAPYGEQMHWTRPMDVLLVGGALPAAGLVGLHAALFWWGVFFSPVLLFVSLLILPWMGRPLVAKDGPRLAVLFTVCQLGVLSSFQPARPDHHSLLAVLFLLSLGLTLRLILHPLRPSLCYGAAAVCAFSIWVSPESLAVTATVLAALGWLWVQRKEDFLPKAVHFSLGLFVFTGLATLAERPISDLATVEFDRLSIIHDGLLGLVGIVFAAAWILGRTRYAGLLTRPRGRLVWGLGGAVLVAAGLALWCPRFFRGPFAAVDPRIIPIWLRQVREVQPLLSSVDFAVPVLGAAVVCLPFLALWSIRKPKGAAWGYVGISLLLFLALSLYQIRWTMYAQILLALVLAELVARRLLRPGDPGYTHRRSLLNAAIITGSCEALMLSGVLVQSFVGSSPRPEPYSRAALQGVCEYLVATPRWQTRPHRILTHLDLGSEILYRTPHEVIATPYHRNAAGILDAHTTFTAPSFAEALPVLRRRAIDRILLPRPKQAEAVPVSSSSPTFSQRLLAGDLPDWCKPVALPESLAHSYALFEVLPP